MATVAPSSDPADLLQKLSLESQTKTLEVPEATKKASAYKRGSVDAKETNGATQPSDRSATPILTEFADPNLCYPYNGYSSPAYYYGGYDGSISEWDDYSRYVNPDGTGVYGDNGSLMYGYGYSPYGPYSPASSPVPTIGHDGQLYGPQQYQYPTFYQSPTPPNEAFNSTQAPASQEMSTSVSADKPALSVEVPNGNAKGSVNTNSNGSMPLKPSQQTSSVNSNGSYGRPGVYPGGVPASGYQDYRYSFDGLKSPVPWLDVSAYNDGKHRPATSSAISTVSHANNIQGGRNQNVRPHPNIMGMQAPRTPGLMPSHYLSRMYSNSRMYGQYGTSYRTGCGYGSNGYDSRNNGRTGWLSVDSKYKPKGRGNFSFGYGNENMDGLNELNRGPRSRGFKNQKTVPLAVKGQNISSGDSTETKDISTVTPDREQYNREDFSVKYKDAKFFIIKSYSEDDVHKSIKYSVWASTPNGNKNLNAGYQESQEKSGDCPVFLCFSVNGSGQFVGLAEMVGPVDFDKSVEYWQQDKWNGCFPVKWHIVKDIPNSLLKQITLENNDNKPVTNSRDTQEVKLEQGLQMLKIFKDHSCKTCILDDFEFYEGRQKTVQEKKAKLQLFQKQAWEGKPVDASALNEKDKEGTNGKVRLQNPLEAASDLTKEAAPVQLDVDCKQSEENGVSVAKDALKDAKPVVTEKRPLANGVANGC
ncbi:hypothetical protein AQUCO_03700175v1 [Aquilegia coerulea]|uniref:YTH domain-containing family protein n=1 Tax=Aquilegia coerulea TaxID=218851 RepID=A0A2G5CTW3_AQUCA|nr:hypothetical protein AQUCO_03700175v1 [Aquilegia coerulea]